MTVQREDILKHVMDIKDNIGDLKQDIGSLKEGVNKIDKDLVDQEKRIRVLESRSMKLGGSIAALTFIAGLIASWASNFFYKG